MKMDCYKKERELVLGLVSTIIPVYNRSELLIEAILSVLKQTYRPIEIIIVDDGSTDDTCAVSDRFAEENPDVIHVVHQNNAGPGAAREAGRLLAKGEFIQYLDSDDLLLPRKFEVQVEALQKHTDCGIAYGYTRLINEQGEIMAAPYKWTGRKIPTLFPSLLVDRWWNTHTPLWRKSLCDEIGPWSNMRMSEDWEYEARVGALRAQLVHCPEFLSDTRQHTNARLVGGQLNKEIIADITRLIVTLFKCAQLAGASLNCPEMKHFSRWAFLVARQAGAAGLENESKECFEIASQAALANPENGIDFKIYRTLTRTLGWKNTGKLFCRLDQILKRKPGSTTIKQSWMEK